MTYTISPWLRQQFFDNNGVPLASGKVYTYVAGTSTPLETYDAATGAANANPIILNSSGVCDMWLGPYSYKFEIKTSADVLIDTIDGVSAIPLTNVDLLITGTAGENLTMGNSVYLSDGTVGTAGRWYKTDSDVAASSTLAKYVGFVPADIASGAVGSIQIQGKVTGLSGLTVGATHYAAATAGAITASAPANAKPVGVADSTTTLIIPALPPEASATVPGIVSTGTQTFGGVKTLNAPTLTGGGSWTGSPSLASPAFTALPTGIGAFQTNYTAAGLTKNNNTTLADVTGLSFPVLANASYQFVFIVQCVTAVAAGFKFTLTGPAAPTAIVFGAAQQAALLAVSAAAAFSTAIQITPTAAQRQTVLIAGHLRNGANAGTVQLQFAQYAADVSDSIVYPDSSVLAFRTA